MSDHQCTAKPPKLDPNSGSGHVEKLGGLDTYISGSSHSKLAVVLVSHVFGYETDRFHQTCFRKKKEAEGNIVAEKEIENETLKKGKSKASLWERAKVAVKLAKQELVTSVVLLHPSRVKVDDIKGVKVPISVLGAEYDQVTPPELVKQFEAILAAKPEVKRRYSQELNTAGLLGTMTMIHQKLKPQRKLTRTCSFGSSAISGENFGTV